MTDRTVQTLEISSFESRTNNIHLEHNDCTHRCRNSDLPDDDCRQTPLLFEEGHQTCTPNQSIYSCVKFWKSVPGALWGGLGLFGESYLLFSIGTLKPLWEILYPQCLETHETCSPLLTSSLAYGVVLGVICGMIIIGTLANKLGRRKGSILTATLMAFGSIGLVLVSLIFQNDASRLFKAMVAMLFLFGIGVGGEYPLSASTASERAMLELQLQHQHQQHNNEAPPVSTKGREVLLTFSMQGMGVFINSLMQSLLLVIMGELGHYQGDDAVYDLNQVNADDAAAIPTYNSFKLFWIWRIIYAFGAIVLFAVLIWRSMRLTESDIWLQTQQKQQCENANSSTAKLILPMTNPQMFKTVLHVYGSRLIGCSLSWLLWDIAFYGNKLFQSTFLRALAGDHATLLDLSLAATLNAFVALTGYYTAAYIVDIPSVGRYRLQLLGFILTGTLFFTCGMLNGASSLPPSITIALYLGSSFFGQCGPNATTFLVPAEIFPTQVRTMCHGIAASAGKVGALLSSVFFNFLHNDKDLFLVSAYASLAAALITYISIPETTTLDLTELDRHWTQITAGPILGENDIPSNHPLAAIQPEFLSLYERRYLTNQAQKNSIEFL